MIMRVREKKDRREAKRDAEERARERETSTERERERENIESVVSHPILASKMMPALQDKIIFYTSHQI